MNRGLFAFSFGSARACSRFRQHEAIFTRVLPGSLGADADTDVRHNQKAMNRTAFLDSIQTKFGELNRRVESAVVPLDDSALNWRADGDRWSIGQILEHVVIGIDHYMPGIEAGVKSGAKAQGDPEIKHSWFGGMIIKGLGPGGKAPVLKQLIPSNGPHTKEILTKWISCHNEVIASAKQAEGLDLSRIKLRNPFFKIFSMNLADFFAILVAHAEGHVLQIEQLAKKAQQKP